MNRILPSCKEVSHLASQALDETLPLSKRLGLRMHLSMCVFCRRYASQLQMIRRLAGGCQGAADNQAELSSEVRKRIAQSLEQADE